MYISKRRVLWTGFILFALLVGIVMLLNWEQVLAQLGPGSTEEVIAQEYLYTGPTGEDGAETDEIPPQAAPAAPAPSAEPVIPDPLGVDPSEKGSNSAPQAGVIEAIPIQGRLTDSGGNAINGTPTITMTLYDAFGGGNILCQDPDLVTAEDGLFFTYMDFCTPSDLDGTQVYLGIQVQGEASEMTPRQPIYLTPYAYSLVNGAHIGSLVSSADSTLFVSPMIMVQSGASNVNWRPYSYGYTNIQANTPGIHYVYIPVNVPGSLYGTQFLLKGLEFCYKLSAAASFVSEIDARYVDGIGNAQVMFTDPTDRTSTTWSCVSISDPTPAVIDGSMMIRFVLNFPNTTDTISIGNTKLILSQP